jgi:hypothetical protein
MKSSNAKWIIALIFAAIVAPTKLSAQITYTVNQTVGTGSMTGYITTDGKIGALSVTDIVGWNLTLKDGTTTIVLTPLNDYVGVIGSDLTASATNLMFNFSNGDYGQVVFADPTLGPGYGVVCIEDLDNNCGGIANSIVIYNLGMDGLTPSVTVSGNQIIASVSSLTSGVGCNGTYTGAYTGNLTVSAGQNCIFVGGAVTGSVLQTGGNVTLIQSTVGGDVQVSGGGTFTIGPNTTINGNVQIQNLPSGPGQNQVCGSTVKGNLQFRNNGTAIEIGSASPCAGNMIGGNLTVQNNRAATTVVGNAVTGNLQDQNNIAATQVFSNVVGNNLQCQNNSSITGGGDTAKSLQGQCSTF